jgi:hypothetical protein
MRVFRTGSRGWLLAALGSALYAVGCAAFTSDAEEPARPAADAGLDGSAGVEGGSDGAGLDGAIRDGGGNADATDDANADADARPATKLVFLSSTTVFGSVTIEGADDACQLRGTLRWPGRTFKAWLSSTDPLKTAAARLTHSTVPYARPDGLELAASWLAAGTDAFYLQCSGWTSTDVAATGRIGDATSLPGWTSAGSNPCNQRYHLYCFEQ